MQNQSNRNLENNIYKYQKRFLTLVEMLIVITILVLFTGVIGINIGRALHEQKFDTEVDLIVERLRLAQSLMLISNKDVSIRIKQTKAGIDLSMEIEGDIPKGWQFMVDRSHIELKTIHTFDFEDQLNYPIVQGQLDILFFSGGAVMSQGVIRLSTLEKYDTPGAIRAAIPLFGYPHPINRVSEEGKLIEVENKDKQADVAITNNTMEEIKQYEELSKASKASRSTP